MKTVASDPTAATANMLPGPALTSGHIDNSINTMCDICLSASDGAII